MKKIFSNIRTMAALLMAGAAFAACSSSDDIIENQQPANNGKQAYTLTISASKDGAATRALTDDNGAIVASWKTTDVIHVTQADGTEIGTLSPTSINGLTATFTGTISGDAQINESDVLTLTYHPIASFSAFASQDGTLSGSENSAENYDMAVATVTISAITGNTITVSESQANFVNQTAVVVLKPYNSSWSEYHSLNSLTVSVTMNNVPVAGTVTEHLGPFTLSGNQPYYFALPSQASLAKKLAAKYSLAENAVSALLASATITFTGHQTGDDYDREYLTCSKTGYKFAAGKYYKLDNSNFSMTMLYKRAVADKDVYVESQDVSWSHTVTFAVNKEIGWKVVGDYVFCGDKQLYVVDNSGPEPSEGWVKASDDHIPFGATYTLEDPAPATGHALSASQVGEIVCSDGLAYAAADKDNLPTGVTAVAIVAYLGDGDTSDNTYNNGLAIAMTNANDGSGCGWGDYFVSYNCVSKSNDIATAIGYKDGISSTNTLTSDDHSGHYHEAATAAASNNGTAAPTGTSGWFLPSMGQWNLIVQGLASKKAGSAVTTDISTSGNDTYTASNLNSVITDAGGTGFNGDYHSSTQYDSESCWHMCISSGRASDYYFYAGDYVRSVLAF